MEQNKGYTRFRKLICKAYCPYYNPSALSNNLTCYGFIFVQEMIQKNPQYKFLLSLRRFNKSVDFWRRGPAKKIYGTGRSKFEGGKKKLKIEGKNQAKNIANKRRKADQAPNLQY